MKRARVNWLYWRSLITSGGCKTQHSVYLGVNKSGVLCQESVRAGFFKVNVSHIMSTLPGWGSPQLKCSHTCDGAANNTGLETGFHFPTCCTGHKHVNVHTHTHNRDIMKHRDVETADETLQLILGLLPMNSHPPPSPSPVSPQAAGISFSIVPHLTLPISHPWPKTLPFFFSPPSQQPLPPKLSLDGAENLLLSAPAGATQQPSQSGIRRQHYDNRAADTQITLTPLFREARLLPASQSPASQRDESWKNRELAITWTWHLRPSPLTCVCPQIHNRSRHSVKQYKANAIHRKRESEAISSSGCVFSSGRPLWEWVNPLHYCFKRWQALVQQQRL